MSIVQLTIFGAGLIGGSVAKSARRAQLAERIVAVDRIVAADCEGDASESSPQENPVPNAVSPFDAWCAVDDEETLRQELARTTLTIVCTPVRTIMELLPKILDSTPGWVTDCGSTKRAILNQVAAHPARRQYVAGHPMAGHPEGGLKNARADLFDGRKWILCPEDSDPGALSLVRDFVSLLGAIPVELSANVHDRSVAQTSHLPQVVASALSVQAESQDALQAAGPGFASATRVAGGAESMWRDIFETNGLHIGRAMQDLGNRLLALGQELEKDNPEATLQILSEARALREKP